MLLLLLLLLHHTHDATGQTLVTNTVAESSAITNTHNTLTFTLKLDAAIAATGTVTISGLTGTQTLDTTTLIVSGADATKFNSVATWTQNTGVLVLTASALLAADTAFIISVDLINPSSTQESVTPTIEIVDAVTPTNIASTPINDAAAVPDAVALVMGAATSDSYLNASATPSDGQLNVHVFVQPNQSPLYSFGSHHEGGWSNGFNVTLTAFATLASPTSCHSSYDSSCPTVTSEPLQFSSVPSHFSTCAAWLNDDVATKICRLTNQATVSNVMPLENEAREDTERMYSLVLQGLTNGYVYNVVVRASTDHDTGAVYNDGAGGNKWNNTYEFHEIPAGYPLMGSTFLKRIDVLRSDPLVEMKSRMNVSWYPAVSNGRPVLYYDVTATPNPSSVHSLTKNWLDAFAPSVNYTATYFEKELERLIAQDAPRSMFYSFKATNTYQDISSCSTNTLVFNATLGSGTTMAITAADHSSEILIGMTVSGVGVRGGGATIVSTVSGTTITLNDTTGFTGLSELTLGPPLCDGIVRLVTESTMLVESGVPYDVVVTPNTELGYQRDSAHTTTSPSTVLPNVGLSVPHPIRDDGIIAEPLNGGARVSFVPPYHGASILLGYTVETIEWNWIGGLVREDAVVCFLFFFYILFNLIFFIFKLRIVLTLYTPLLSVHSSPLLFSPLLSSPLLSSSLLSLFFHPTPLPHMHAHTGLLQLIDVSST